MHWPQWFIDGSWAINDWFAAHFKQSALSVARVFLLVLSWLGWWLLGWWVMAWPLGFLGSAAAYSVAIFLLGIPVGFLIIRPLLHRLFEEKPKPFPPEQDSRRQE